MQHEAPTTLRDTLAAGSLLPTFHDANMPLDDQGRVYHLGCKRGDVAPRVISVGDPRRAALLATFLDNGVSVEDNKNNNEGDVNNNKSSSVRMTPSKRGFTTYTGTYKGVPVSIIATGMGLAMMDFLVREARAVVDGPMLIIRLGTAGTPRKDVVVGSMAMATAAVCISRKYDAFDESEDDEDVKTDAKRSICFYQVSKPCRADAELTGAIKQSLQKSMADVGVIEGLNATGDSFYSSQGRLGREFEDHNETLVEDLLDKHPDLVSLEMETYQLLHLARVSRAHVPIRAAAVTILLANRITNAFAEPAVLTKRESDAGRAVLDAIISVDLTSTKRPGHVAMPTGTAEAAPAAP